MKLFALGATGGTGGEVVGQALERGHRVTAFVRSPEKIAHRHDWLRVPRTARCKMTRTIASPSPSLPSYLALAAQLLSRP
jgi:hypothetical protein